MKWTIFVTLRATPQWLQHTPQQREKIASDCLAEVMVDNRVGMRFFDAEAFSGECSDVAVFEASDMLAYYFTMERLRNTALISAPYFEVVSIIPAVENGFQLFQEAEEERVA